MEGSLSHPSNRHRPLSHLPGLTPTGRHLPYRKDNANAITGENRPAGRKNSAVSRFI